MKLVGLVLGSLLMFSISANAGQKTPAKTDAAPAVTAAPAPAARTVASVKDESLKRAVLKMKKCYGIDGDDGKEFVFSAKKVTIRTPNSAEGSYDNTYGNSYEGYDASYGNKNMSSEEHAWAVKGSEVLITFGNVKKSLMIGFKSKTCWFR